MSNSVPVVKVNLDGNDNVYSYEEVSSKKLNREYEVRVTNEHIRKSVDIKLKEIASNTQLPGFRLNKQDIESSESIWEMHYNLLLENYKDKALEYAIRDVIDNCLSDLIKKKFVKLYTHPEVNVILFPSWESGIINGDLVYRLSFDVMPEVPVLDINNIALKKFEVKIEENDIKEFIDSIKVKFPNFLPINDTSYNIKSGDKVVIDYEGRVRGKLFKGGNGKAFTLVLGSGKVLSNFEDQLIGMKVGEGKSFKLRFPDDYHIISVAGQEADFFVQVSDIQVINDFKNDEEVAKSIGFENYSTLVSYAKKAVISQCNEINSIIMKKELFDQIDNNYNFDLPEKLVRQEQERVNQEKANNSSESSDNIKEAERRVKLAMLFMKFSTDQKIFITQEDILSVIKQYVNDRVRMEDVLKRLRSNKQFGELVKGQALEYKVTDFIIKNVHKENKTVSVKELKNYYDNI
ncbi:trigger factor [Wolbachia endosymbiont of Pentidionis agamae]|uniref:trigger factor n=1 Tax=Wolbachia endosymbiont of Pentidionis agamae TaxID=3110435 RepID=UPI002FD2CD8A